MSEVNPHRTIGAQHMGKKIRIAILYNEPTSGTEQTRKYVAENGQLKEGPPRRKASHPVKQPVGPNAVDLSEIGVMEEMEDIKVALTELGYKPTVMNVNGDIFRLIDYLREERPDLIFNLVECVENESEQEMNVAGIYELLKIPYTGAPAFTLGTLLHKARVKEILTYHGIKTPRFQMFDVKDRIGIDGHLSFPLIVKPSREDASVGIDDDAVVYTVNDLKKRIRYVLQEFEQPALVEEFIKGRELNVAILGNKPPTVLPISEIDFSGLTDGMHHIVSYAAKWMHGTVEYEGTKGICPALLPLATEARIKDIALRCYTILGCRDYARVDLRLTKDGVPYVLEVNPNPDISDDAGFARSARAYGLGFSNTIGKIVEIALERARQEQHL
jgi:D-alanine-D-alanine ligase